MELGDKIHAIRVQRGMTLEQVGDIVGVGKSTVRKWESGQIANMRRDKISKIAKALNVTPGYLMGWDNDSTEKRCEQFAALVDPQPRTIDDTSNEFISLFMKLSPENRTCILDLIKALLTSQL